MYGVKRLNFCEAMGVAVKRLNTMGHIHDSWLADQPGVGVKMSGIIFLHLAASGEVILEEAEFNMVVAKLS